jgi:hypothetical protein
MVLSVIQGITLNIGVLPFSKGRTLQSFIKGFRTGEDSLPEESMVS